MRLVVVIPHLAATCKRADGEVARTPQRFRDNGAPNSSATTRPDRRERHPPIYTTTTAFAGTAPIGSNRPWTCRTAVIIIIIIYYWAAAVRWADRPLPGRPMIDRSVERMGTGGPAMSERELEGGCQCGRVRYRVSRRSR